MEFLYLTVRKAASEQGHRSWPRHWQISSTAASCRWRLISLRDRYTLSVIGVAKMLRWLRNRKYEFSRTRTCWGRSRYPRATNSERCPDSDHAECDHLLLMSALIQQEVHTGQVSLIIVLLPLEHFTKMWSPGDQLQDSLTIIFSFLICSFILFILW